MATEDENTVRDLERFWKLLARRYRGCLTSPEAGREFEEECNQAFIADEARNTNR